MPDDIKAALAALDAAIDGIADAVAQHQRESYEWFGVAGLLETARVYSRALESEIDAALDRDSDEYRARVRAAAAELRAADAAYRAAVL